MNELNDINLKYQDIAYKQQLSLQAKEKEAKAKADVKLKLKKLWKGKLLKNIFD